MKKLQLLFIICCSLITLFGCKNLFEAPKEDKPVVGKGSFSLSIDGVRTGRTILPTTVQSDFAVYTMEFFVTGTTVNPVVSEERTNANLADPVLLDTGTWDVYITAFMDTQKAKPAAKGNLKGIVIGSEATVNSGVTLNAIIEEGEGVFSWVIDFAANVVLASMTIIPLDDVNGTPEQTMYFIGGTPAIDKEDSITLNAGYYRVVFVLYDDESRSYELRKILHVYKNLESAFDNDFTASQFAYLIIDVAEIGPYLATAENGTIDDPASLRLQIDLGTMTQAGSGWRQLLDAIEAADKCVSLDLSACTMNGTEFNPDYSVATGKDKIVEIDLPDVAISIASGNDVSGTASFEHFTALTSFSGKGLTSIGILAFNGCTSLALTSLPEGITSIDEQAFYNCTSLALTSLPEGLTSIGDAAFFGCTSLALTNLPEGITSIEDFAFENCTSLELTSLPEGLTSIGDAAFSDCTSLALTSLPEGITSIGQFAFFGCTSLALTNLPEGITSIDFAAFYGCTSLALTSLPEGITSINEDAFQYCTSLALTSLPEGLTSIGSYAFSDCTSLALTSLPEGLTSINNGAFRDCTNLALTSLPEGLTSIDFVAFGACTSLALTSLPEGITSIGSSAFSGCTSLELTSLPEGLTSIGSYAFSDCTSLALTSLPEGLTSINNGAFRDCTSFALVTCLAETPPELGSNVFYNTHSSLQIKVPVGSVEAYKAAPGWSEYAGLIVAIEE